MPIHISTHEIASGKWIAVLMYTVRTGRCDCCKLEHAIMAQPRNPDGLPAEVRICGICTRHLGDYSTIARKREQAHFDLWAEDAREHAEQAAKEHSRQVAVLQERVAELLAELEQRPTRVVTVNLDQQRVNEALEHRQAAYRSRDNAFRALSEIHMLHHNSGGEQCVCAKPYQQCEIARIVDAYPALKGWERKQWERKQQGLEHLLPPRHPGVIDYRWRPDGN